MAELQRNFLQGVMNKDLDPHFLPDGQYRDALNIIVGDSDGQFIAIEGSNNGAAQNYLGNELQNTSLGLTNAQCIGSLSYEANNLIYWLVAADNADAIYEYNETLGLTTIVLKATKSSPNILNVTNNGSGNYVINGVSNPTLNLVEGQTYTFNISAPGHPFWIKTVSSIGTVNAYNTGVTNNGTDNGTITFVVPVGAPATLYYNCQFHSSMAGTINVTDVPIPSILNFNKTFYVTGINYINGLLFWTDNYNPPRRINIERAKNYGVNGFTEEDINVIVAPPIAAPTIALSNTGDSNNLENKFVYFSYRYKYIDNEYSALSPFSPVAFLPKHYEYDYGVSENISMTNINDTVTITYDVGGDNVTEIQLIYRNTLSLNTYVIDNIQKNTLASVGPYTYEFKDNKVYTILDPNQVNRLFDNVPLKAKSQDLIGSRLIYGNYTQFFDLIDCDDIPINPQFSLSLTAQTITGLNPKPTFKSNRDYEIGIVYLDDYARSTTVITPNGDNTIGNTNTIYIPPQNSNLANNIRITINEDFKPPCFATYYRFVLKQNKQDFYNIFPLTYFSDGEFKWFLLNQADVDKVPLGAYLYLKSFTQTSNNVQYKILDVVSKSANFLNNSNSQPAGVYFKVKIDANLLPPVYYYKFTNISNSGLGLAPVQSLYKVAERAIFYGVGQNHMTTGNSNAYAGLNDVRFKVQISDVNKFKYYAFVDGVPYVYVSELTIIPGVDQQLMYVYNSITYSCYINFSSITGLVLKDYWVVNCRSTTNFSGNYGLNIFGGKTSYVSTSHDCPYGFVTGTDWNLNGVYVGDRSINAGAVLTIKMKEPNNGNTTLTQTFLASKDYINIEEWFIESNIYLSWVQYQGAVSIGAKNVCFRRINNFHVSTGSQYQCNQGGVISNATLSQPVFMWIYGHTTGASPTMEVTFDFQESEYPSIFETVPTDSNLDIYYELSKTYPITNGNHIGNVQNQVVGTTPAIVDLNTYSTNSDFNAFAWGNNVESYRIRDDFNAATMEFSPRANSTIEGYEQQTLVQALTYSGVYQQTTAINRLNEFNLSLGNFKYLDRFFGSIEKIYARDTDLVVLQENKISKVLYGKNLLSDSTGGGVVASVPEVLGTQIAYVGEYGISNNPESFAIWGNNLYFTDARRGAVLQLAENGLFEISSNGLKNWFKANLDPATQKLGMFDPYFEHYVLANNDQLVQYCVFEVTEDVVSFGTPALNDQYAFTINSNNQWYIEVPANNWLTLNTLYGNDNTLIYFDTLVNTGSSRSVTVVVRGCGGTHNVVFTQAGVTTLPPTTLPPTTLPPTTLPPTTLPPTVYYKLDSCSAGYGQLYTSIFPGTSPTTLANQRYIDSVTLVYYVWDNTSTIAPGTIGTNLQKVSGQVGCPGPTTLPPTTTLPPPMNLEVRICGGVTTYFITVTNQGLTNGLALKLTKAGTPFDGIDCWEIIDNATTHAIDYNLVTVNSISLSCVSCVTPTTPTPTTTTTCAASTYYELSECSPGVGIAYTLIAPTLGVGQRYVLPSPETFYTYTGSSISQCTVPPTYNGSIQATGFTGCPSPTTLPPTTLAPLVVTNGVVTCSGINGSWTSSFSGGTGVYDYIAYASSQANAALAIVDPLLRISLSPGALNYSWSSIANGTWYVAMMDSSGTYTVQNTPVVVSCTTTTLPPTTTLTPEWYQLTSCADGSTIYSTQYTIGSFGINNRVTIIGGAIFRITATTSVNPGGAQQNITQTFLTGCPATTTLPPPTTTLSPMSFTYSTSCSGGSGIITINSISGGTGTGYEFSIQPTPGIWYSYPASNQLSGLANNTYTVAVRDSLGNGTSTPGIVISCVAPTTIAPTTLPPPTTTLAPVVANVSYSCPGTYDGTGQIIISGSGGTGSYQYSINNGTTFSAQTTYSNLGNGWYYVAVKDSNGSIGYNSIYVNCAAPTTPAPTTPTPTTPAPATYTYLRYDVDTNNCGTSNPTPVWSFNSYGNGYYYINGSGNYYYLQSQAHGDFSNQITSVSAASCTPITTPAPTTPAPTTPAPTTPAPTTTATPCRTYQIIGYNTDEYVDGVYTNCAGFPDSFSLFGGPGTVGYVCAQPSSVYITSGNGAATDVGAC